jgi:hypothetical protein
MCFWLGSPLRRMGTGHSASSTGRAKGGRSLVSIGRYCKEVS